MWQYSRHQHNAARIPPHFRVPFRVVASCGTDVVVRWVLRRLVAAAGSQEAMSAIRPSVGPEQLASLEEFTREFGTV
jgi:hypothetical protein